MRNRLLSFLLLFALVSGSILTPEISHAETPAVGHGTDAHDHAGKGEDENSREEGTPCHAIAHHHCSIALQVGASRIDLNGLTTASLVRPASTSPLLSRSQPPPLDPPIA